VAADIESLIRQALARQNGFDPQVRASIYQSSRNALAKMIAKSGMIPPGVIETRNAALERTISKIEHEFTAEVASVPQNQDQGPDQPGIQNNPTAQNPRPQSPDVPSAPLSIPPSFESGPGPAMPTRSTVNDNFAEPIAVDDTGTNHAPRALPKADAPELNVLVPVGVNNGISPDVSDLQVQYAEPTPQYARPRRQPIRYVIWLTALAIFAVVGWVAYMITIEFLDAGKPAQQQGQVSSSGNGTTNGKFVTILDPSQPGALVTAGNGTATILSDISQPAIRIMSLRKPDAQDKSADPMLLELAPGILKNIAGKKVTVEILAKSGETGAATFSVGCQFGDLGECGRKRFRIGLQPEAVVFSIQISADYREGQRAFLAINTDVTSAAALSGKGAQIDIIYARIRTP